MNPKVVLCILDGWGINSNNQNDPKLDGISATVHWPELLKKYPHTTLQASENHVGLPKGQMGNSEVGHMTIGLGRVPTQDLPKINQQFTDNKIESNPFVVGAITKLKSTKKPCHIIGLLSPGGVHSHMHHMIEAAKLLSNAGITVNVHALSDGRDTPPQSAKNYVGEFLKATQNFDNIRLATIGGRYYAMDRDNRWERINLAYSALVDAQAPKFSDVIQTIQNSYDSGVTDEFLIPTVHEAYAGMQNGDGLWMINFRADRVRQILRSLLLNDFSHFPKKRSFTFGPTMGMNDYAEDLAKLIPTIFVKDDLTSSLGEVIANLSLKQLRVAETEKYAHVTFFLNGGHETPFDGEERIMIPSPKIATYDLQPEMAAVEVTKTVLTAMERDDLALIVVNYANPDMVGHTGVIKAIHQAIICVDNCLKLLEQQAIQKNWILLITADHGNVECMREADGLTPHTAHTCNPVPFMQINGPARQLHTGTLADIAPTVLEIMNIPQPKEMTGKSLIC